MEWQKALRGLLRGGAIGFAGYLGGERLAGAAYDVVRDGAIGARGQLSKVYNWFSGADATAPEKPEIASAANSNPENTSPASTVSYKLS